jgi:sortase A
VIAAHRDTHFALLRNVTRGDVVRIRDRRGVESEYRIVDLKIVDKHQQPRVGGKSVLLLSTCYPFDAITPGGPLRFVVVAERTRRVDALVRPEGPAGAREVPVRPVVSIRQQASGPRV